MKWYISALVIILAFLGICINQVSSPNQEILVQFNSKEITMEQSEGAIDFIKRQLQNFGIESFHINKGDNGDLRISYHSSIDVESIKKALSTNELDFDFVSLNKENKGSKKQSERHKKNYNLDVYELHKTSEGSNSAGTNVIVVKQDYERYLNPNLYPSFDQMDFGQQLLSEKLSSDSFNHVALAINNTSHIIPEVRAGPISIPS
ncbi:MAG: hypothetical protein R2797_05575 [Gelidibacter sp.]